MSLRIVFMGTPEFSIPTLQSLITKNFNVVHVYTQPPKKSKRGQKINASPVELFCKKKNLSFRNPYDLNNTEEHEFFKKISADLVVVVAYGKLIPKNFLNLTKFGFINIHASLLPKWRGAAPIHRAIMNEDRITGVSLMKIKEKLDSGPVLATKKLEISESLTSGEAEKKLSKLGAELLIENLEKIKNNSEKFLEQNESEATYAKKIKKKEARISWNLNAKKVLAHIHGLSPNPGAWFQYKNERYKVLSVKKSNLRGKPGVVLDNQLTVACQSDSIQILEIQREGKNRQKIKDFLIGNKINKDTILN
tara:strand:- start:323 stop:1243 length:921 start_codon:yes stop_codon:yes gene_type:complete